MVIAPPTSFNMSGYFLYRPWIPILPSRYGWILGRARSTAEGSQWGRGAGAVFCYAQGVFNPTKIMIFSQIIQQNGWHCTVSVANIGILNFKQQEKGDFSREKWESSPERNGDLSWLIGHKRQGIHPGQSHTDSPNAAKVLPRITLHIQYLDDP